MEDTKDKKAPATQKDNTKALEARLAQLEQENAQLKASKGAPLVAASGENVLEQIKAMYEVPEHTIPENEKNYVHAAIVRHEIQGPLGRPKFKPHKQIFEPNGWNNFLEHPNGFIVLKIYNKGKLPAPAMTVEEMAKKKAAAREEELKRIERTRKNTRR